MKTSRFYEGDLVTIKYSNSPCTYPSVVGIVVAVQNRSSQNVLWDRLWVLMNGTMEVFPHRTLEFYGK